MESTGKPHKNKHFFPYVYFHVKTKENKKKQKKKKCSLFHKICKADNKYKTAVIQS